ncbi:MAG: hypothetical protein R3Y47_07810 [Lachnospiraceae bacterium]
MNDMDDLEEKLASLDSLVQALTPFVAPSKKQKLLQISAMLAPFKHLKEIIRMMEMVQTLQKTMQANEDGALDLSALSGYLNEEQIQMFEMLKMMHEMGGSSNEETSMDE